MRQARKVASDKPYIHVPHIPDLINNTHNSFNLLDFQFCSGLFITITSSNYPEKLFGNFSSSLPIYDSIKAISQSFVISVTANFFLMPRIKALAGHGGIHL